MRPEDEDARVSLEGLDPVAALKAVLPVDFDAPPVAPRLVFTAEDVTPRGWTGANTANVYFDVAVPDGATGHAVRGIGEPQEVDDVAAALNRAIAGEGADWVVEQLTSPNGLRL
jgi:hypothetical protein